uniref:Uncharacterized protein n=1 Tax=Alexandrium catenella TaxID=2925 RepID=A0A7S1S3J9_ALECA
MYWLATVLFILPGAVSMRLLSRVQEASRQETAARLEADLALSREIRAMEKAAVSSERNDWQAFLATSSHSARSWLDRERHHSIETRVEEDHSVDIPMADYFQGKVDAAGKVPRLSELAKKLVSETAVKKLVSETAGRGK